MKAEIIDPPHKSQGIKKIMVFFRCEAEKIKSTEPNILKETKMQKGNRLPAIEYTSSE